MQDVEQPPSAWFRRLPAQLDPQLSCSAQSRTATPDSGVARRPRKAGRDSEARCRVTAAPGRGLCRHISGLELAADPDRAARNRRPGPAGARGRGPVPERGTHPAHPSQALPGSRSGAGAGVTAGDLPPRTGPQGPPAGPGRTQDGCSARVPCLPSSGLGGAQRGRRPAPRAPRPAPPCAP